MYKVYIITKEGEGMVQQIWEGEDMTDFIMYTSIFGPGNKIVIEYETKPCKSYDE